MFCHLDISNTDLMELRDLRALLAVVRSGSFTVAADELGYTQSAVSQHVAALERELGHRLLQRRPVRPTAAGERLAEHAARILLRVDVARSELARLDQEPAELRVAVCPLAAPGLVASALRQLRVGQSSVRVTISSIDARTAVAEIASGRVDVALVDGFTAPDNPLALADAGLLSSTALVEVPVVVALPIGHPLQGRTGIDLDVLADAPWIIAPALAGRGTTSLASRGSVVYEGNDLPTLLGLVAAGHGSALLPESSCARAEGIVAIPLRNPRLVHRTELLALRSPNPGQRRLIDALRSRASLE
jgi:DNA-binding transcriptional LysR family regulator